MIAPLHLLYLKAAFGACALIGGALLLFSLAILATQQTRDGMLVMTYVMAALFLFGVAGLLEVMP